MQLCKKSSRCFFFGFRKMHSKTFVFVYTKQCIFILALVVVVLELMSCIFFIEFCKENFSYLD